MGSEKHMHDDASPSINSSPKTNDEGLSKVTSPDVRKARPLSCWMGQNLEDVTTYL